MCDKTLFLDNKQGYCFQRYSIMFVIYLTKQYSMAYLFKTAKKCIFARLNKSCKTKFYLSESHYYCF